MDPGLVFDNGPDDFTRYQCNANRPAVSPPSLCTTVGTLDQTFNYNLPSITVGSVAGVVTVTRRVTNVSGGAATYSSSVSVPNFTAVVTPSTLTLAAGETQTFTVRLTSNGAADGVWNYGSMTWTDGTHVVKSPVTLRTGKLIAAPREVTGTTASGTRLIGVQTGFAGRMSAIKGGMKPVALGATVSLTPAPLTSAALISACTNGTSPASVRVYPVTVPAGTLVARFELRQVDTGDALQDHDMAVVPPTGTALYSGNDGSEESIQIASPAAGTYKVCVLAYGGAATMTHKLSSWVVTPADQFGNMNVLVPTQAYVGGQATVGLTWSNLAAGGRYLGAFGLADTSGAVQATTVVRVNPGGTVLSSVDTHPVGSGDLKK
jgi:hypothetical protein